MKEISYAARHNQSAEFLIRIYSYDNWVLQGHVEHLHGGDACEFHSLTELILLVQSRLDELDYPQSAVAIRSWTGANRQISVYNLSPVGSTQSSGDKPLSLKPQASFLLRIHYRQNAGWQGNINWLENKKTCAFRSVLEMILLIQEALESNATREKSGEAQRTRMGWQTKSSVS